MSFLINLKCLFLNCFKIITPQKTQSKQSPHDSPSEYTITKTEEHPIKNESTAFPEFSAINHYNDFMYNISTNFSFESQITNPEIVDKYMRFKHFNKELSHIHICILNNVIQFSDNPNIYETQIIEKTTNFKISDELLRNEFFINKFCEYKKISGIVKYISYAPQCCNSNSQQYSIYMKEYQSDIFDHFVKNDSSFHITIENIFPRLSDIIHVGLQLSHTLRLMHDNNIIHRDIKPENLFIDKHINVFIGDFGFCEYNPNDIVTKLCGTENYVDPNMYKADLKKPMSAKASDVYSLGVTLWAILFKSYPYYIKEEPFTIDTIPTKYIPFLKLPFINLMLQMIQPNPTKRPTMSKVNDSIKQFKQSHNQYKHLEKNNFI